MGHGFVSLNDRFLAIYDQNLGSLRLSSRMMDQDILRKCGDTSIKIAEAGGGRSAEVMNFLKCLREEIEQEIVPVPISKTTESAPKVSVIMPGSVGICNSRRVIVGKVFYHPQHGICYKGKAESGEVDMLVPFANMEECEESKMGLYDPDMGDVEEEN